MTDDRARDLHQRAKRVFVQLVDLHGAERDGALVRLCGDDGALREEVESLLDHAETETDHLQPTLVGQGDDVELLSAPSRLLAELRQGWADRLQAGQALSDRYELQECLGRGGMGEVWRARDRMLGETVALKFIHGGPGKARSRAWVDRLLNEVSAARRVAHPNVCRVHDAGEADGEFFFSMEYVPGGDLSERLRDGGRLDAAASRVLARELTSALAAIHAAGLLHRDLKPANILFDAQGAARLSDFGLALAAEEAAGEESRSGTRAYMAPELTDGGAPSAQSDLFALGLVLYEAVTNRRAFRSGREVARYAERGELPPAPSLLVKDVDPVLERVVMHCLAPRPEDRPASAAELLEVLEERDPLTAVLALGDLPSADVIAASTARGVLGARGARVVLGACAVMLAVIVALSPLMQGEGPLPRVAPEERAAEARAMLDRLDGASERWTSRAFAYGGLEDIAGPPGWNHALPGGRDLLRCFWLRESTGHLEPQGWAAVLFGNGRVEVQDPPANTPGVRTLILGADGRLVAFRTSAVPVDHALAGPLQPDGATVDLAFDLARLDRASFTPTTPLDATAAVGSALAWVDATVEPPRRVELAHAGPRLLSFEVLTAAPSADAASDGAEEPASGGVVRLFVIAAMFAVILPLALRQLRSGRGDHWGAARLALTCGSTVSISWFLVARFPARAEARLLYPFPGVLIGVGAAVLVWLFYMALEPAVQRRWPRVLVSWGRFLRGRRRDPLVLSHVLLGVALGLLAPFFDAVSGVVAGVPVKVAGNAMVLSGSNPLHWLYVLTDLPNGVVLVSLQFLAGLVIFKAVFRSERVSVAALWLLGVSVSLVDAEHALGAVGAVLAVTVILVVLLRYGLLTLVFLSFTTALFAALPVAPSIDAWYAGGSAVSLGVAAALALASAVPLLRAKAPGPREA